MCYNPIIIPLRKIKMNSKSKNNIKGTLILVLTSLIWGLAFVAQSDASDLIPSFAFNSMRSFVGAAFLLVVIIVKSLKSKEKLIPEDKIEKKRMLISGTVCGVLLAVSVNFQQLGLSLYPSGTASEARGGFLTALYVILVPIFYAIGGKKVAFPVWIGVVIAWGGIYMLCFSGGISGIYLGDVMILLCAVAFTFHILAIDNLGKNISGIKLSFIQFVVCGLISGIVSLFFEKVSITEISAAVFQILYLGIMSSGVGYTLQIIGQKYAEPAIASMAMSLESVFAALGGWLIAGNAMSVHEIIGGLLVFSAIVIAQLPQRKKSSAT